MSPHLARHTLQSTEYTEIARIICRFWPGFLNNWQSNSKLCVFRLLCSHVQHEYLWPLIFCLLDNLEAPRFSPHFTFVCQRFREKKWMKDLLPNMPWVCKLLVMPSQTLEFPGSLPVFTWHLLWSFGWKRSLFIWATSNNLNFYYQPIWTILGHLLYNILKGLERWVCTIKGKVFGSKNSSQEIHV